MRRRPGTRGDRTRNARRRGSDEEVADRRLYYELRRHHVGLRLTGGVAEVRSLERAATEAAALLGPGAPLVVLSGAASVDVWCGVSQHHCERSRASWRDIGAMHARAYRRCDLIPKELT